jgi:O-antigen ligase
VLGVLLLVALASVAFALVEFVGDPGVRRQASFLGEHDLAALCVTVTATGLAGLFARTPSRWLVWPVIVLGGVGAVLAATLASLVGLYLAAAVVVLVAAVRASFRWQGALATVLVVVAVSAGTLGIRSGDLGFLQVLAGKQEQEPGQFAASWSQRLVYAYVALRVFEDNPIVGTGWYPLLPPDEFAQYVPDARARFDNQPANYFPPTDAPYIPQQAPDQILSQLGLVGAALFLALVAALARAATGAARAWPRDRDELLAYVPGAWLGSLVGALCGAALFGGTPIAALFWLTLGVIAAVSRLLPDPAVARVPGHRVSEAVR